MGAEPDTWTVLACALIVGQKLTHTQPAKARENLCPPVMSLQKLERNTTYWRAEPSIMTTILTQNLCPPMSVIPSCPCFLPMAGQILAHHHREYLPSRTGVLEESWPLLLVGLESCINGGEGCLWGGLLKFLTVSCVFGVPKPKWGVLCLPWVFYFDAVRSFNFEGGVEVRRKILRVWFGLV